MAGASKTTCVGYSGTPFVFGCCFPFSTSRVRRLPPTNSIVRSAHETEYRLNDHHDDDNPYLPVVTVPEHHDALRDGSQTFYTAPSPSLLFSFRVKHQSDRDIAIRLSLLLQAHVTYALRLLR